MWVAVSGKLIIMIKLRSHKTCFTPPHFCTCPKSGDSGILSHNWTNLQIYSQKLQYLINWYFGGKFSVVLFVSTKMINDLYPSQYKIKIKWDLKEIKIHLLTRNGTKYLRQI